MKKARSIIRTAPPRVLPDTDAAESGGLPPTPGPSAGDGGGRRPFSHELLVAFNALAIVVVIFGGLRYALLLPPGARVMQAIVIAATLLMAFAAILITPAYLGGWIDRPKAAAPRDDGSSAPPASPGEPPEEVRRE